MTSFGEILNKRNITQAELSRRSGISKGFISDLVSGKKNLSLKTAVKIANALSIDLNELATIQAARKSRENGDGQAEDAKAA